MYAVYKVTGTYTDVVYYGYCEGDDPKTKFLLGANATRLDGTERGAGVFVQENDGDFDAIKVEIVDSADDGFEAMCIRNDLRSTDTWSITGPTFWPYGSPCIEQQKPGALQRWKSSNDIRTAESARKAFILGGFTKDQIDSLKVTQDRKQLVLDFDNLLPMQFASKYNVELSYQVS